MAPKNNAKGGDKKGPAKGKGKDAEDAKGKGKGGVKGAQSINVRHILVCSSFSSQRPSWCSIGGVLKYRVEPVSNRTRAVRETC